MRCMGHGIFVLNMFGLYNLSISARLVGFCLIVILSLIVLSLIFYPPPPARQSTGKDQP